MHVSCVTAHLHVLQGVAMSSAGHPPTSDGAVVVSMHPAVAGPRAWFVRSAWV